MRGPLGAFFRGFNKVFDVTTNGYVNVSRLLVRRGIVTIGIVGVVVLGAGLSRSDSIRFHSRRRPGSSVSTYNCTGRIAGAHQ